MAQNQGQDQDQSAFNERSDNAALRLKGQISDEMSQRFGRRVDLPQTPVPVNEQGQPIGMEQPPPDGSYAQQAWEEQRAAQAQHDAMVQHQRATQPQAFQPEALHGSPPHEQPEQTSQRAEQRINSLVSQLRQKDQDYARLQHQLQEGETSRQELQAQVSAAQEQINTIMREHMENLDPETRAAVMTDARIRQAVATSEQRIIQAITPRLDALQIRNDQLEKQRLANTYQGYRPEIHDEMIDAFRSRNRQCSIEQAFRAVCTPDELSVGSARPANAPPPAVPPGNGSQTPRYMPQSFSQPDPVDQMRQDARDAAKLARSLDPEDQKRATALWHKNLADRLGMSVPGQ